MKPILAIDTGYTESGWCVLDGYTPTMFGKSRNEYVLKMICRDYSVIVIERVAGYGMPVGKEVFETCEWVGKFSAMAQVKHVPCEYIYRRDEKLFICHDSRAKDVNIRRALIERFAKHDFVNGKGTKDNRDFFYGFHSDVWSAFAVGVTYLDKKGEEDAREKQGTLNPC